MPHSAVVPTLQERKQELVRSAIWEAAADLFAQKGYDETTVDDIAEKAGVSRRSFFRYFSSKSDLMAHGIAGYVTQLTETIASFPPDCPPAEVFRQTVRKVARQCAEHPHTRKVIEIASRYPDAKQAQLSRIAQLQERVEEAYARRPHLRKDDVTPGILAGVTLSALSVIFRSWFERGEDDIAGAAERVLSMLGELLGRADANRLSMPAAHIGAMKAKSAKRTASR